VIGGCSGSETRTALQTDDYECEGQRTSRHASRALAVQESVFRWLSGYRPGTSVSVEIDTGAVRPSVVRANQPIVIGDELAGVVWWLERGVKNAGVGGNP